MRAIIVIIIMKMTIIGSERKKNVFHSFIHPVMAACKADKTCSEVRFRLVGLQNESEVKTGKHNLFGLLFNQCKRYVTRFSLC